ncbi:MAG TPA: 2-phospho-L-lactate guanylyltransferase [Actinomycetota bacterium]|jgi:2-phospho-L-lactate guanylyltransferase|nr:2-phospho-L-lactate guanylyltransferase [Actinomycetota bacterium]
MPVPLIPVKALAEAKGRLAPEVGPLQRRLLAIAMFEDVVAALQSVRGLERPVVVSPDREVWRRADAMGCRVVEEPAGAGDLNGALAAAAATANGSGLLVVAADLPLASAAGLERVLAAATAPVAVVPSHDGGGTNVLAWRDPASFAPSFGPASAARHLAVPGAVRVDEPGLALDVDTADDLRLVAGRLDPASVTARRLRDLGVRGLT